MIIELTDSDLIEKGKKRNCYRHPDNPNSCLKIEINETRLNKNDLNAYGQIPEVIKSYLPNYYGIHKTSKGMPLSANLLPMILEHLKKLLLLSSIKAFRQLP